MKIFLTTLLHIAYIVIGLLFFIACFTAFIPSLSFSYAVFFALLFPYLFIALLCIAIGFLFVNRKKSGLFFALLVLGFYNFFHVVAMSPLAGWTMTKDTSAIRIMTWNVSDFINPAKFEFPESLPRRQILETIQEYNPDILCMQEYDNVDSSRDVASVKHELDSLGYHYLLFSGDQTFRTFWGRVEKGTAIASKTPFLSTGLLQIRKDISTENLVYADMNFNNKILRINTAHLKSFYLFPDSAQGYDGKKKVAKKIYTYKHNVEEKLRDIEAMHDQQVAMINRFLDTSSYPVIYCGDMNATSCMYSYRNLKGNKQDAFLEKGNGIGATFYNIVPTLRIDMCFPDNHFSVQQCTVVKRKLGDHYPVVTDIKWNQ